MKKLFSLLLAGLCVVAHPSLEAYAQRAGFFGQNAPTAIAVGTPTLLHTSPTTIGCASTTCTITLTSAIAANHLVTIECFTDAPVVLGSISAGGTLIPVMSSSGVGQLNTGFESDGYIYPTTSATTSVTISALSGYAFSANSGCVLREWSFSAGTPILDWTHGTSVASASHPYNGETPFYSGTSDLTVQSTVTEGPALTGVTVYTGFLTKSLDGTNPAWSYLLNSSVTTPPSWTLSSSPVYITTTGMAFATNATPCQDVAYNDWSGSTNGTVITAALLNSTGIGLPITGASSSQGSGWALSTTPATGMTFVSGSPTAYHAGVQLCNGGTKNGANGFYLQYNWSNATVKYAQLDFIGSHKCSIGMYVNSTFPGSDTTFHDSFGCGAVAANFVGVQRGGSGTQQQVRLECNGAGGTTNFSTAISTTASADNYITMLNDDAVGGSLEICSDSHCGTVTAGPVTCTASSWTVKQQDTFQIGQGGGTADFPTAVEKYGPPLLDPLGTFPLVTK